MPTVLDATVINQAYDTSGNAGRKLVRLENGTLIAITKNANVDVQLYKSTDNGVTWSVLYDYNTGTITGDFCIETDGINVFVLLSLSNTNVRSGVIKEDGTWIQGLTAFESGQTTIGNVSLTINEAGTELHATWSSKNSSYPNSFNIRYAKGTINADGSVVWGAVEQWSMFNQSTSNLINPTISIKDGKAYVIVETNQANVIPTGNSIILLTSAFSTKNFGSITNFKAEVGTVLIYHGGSYTQSSPSAIFVPQSVNGLANGRIWAAWHGYDATDTTGENLRVSYSDDGGITWSAMTKLTSGQSNRAEFASLTANKKGEVFIVFSKRVYDSVNYFKFASGSWGSMQTILGDNGTTLGQSFPSTLFDLTIDFTSPLFIFRNNRSAKVGFYGTWTVTTISVQQGVIGEKTDKDNLLTYTITTDGTMSDVVEKVNGVEVGRKTVPSGQSLIVGLTQAQWDAVRFGKYADVTGGKNTLTIEMGSETWTYTFDKRLATDADILSAVKAVQDSNEVYLPAVKSELASAIRSKGGTVNDTDALEVMASAVGELPLKKYASGTASVSASTLSFSQTNNVTVSLRYIEVNDLDFEPNAIIAWIVANGQRVRPTIYYPDFFPDETSTGYNEGRVTVQDTLATSGSGAIQTYVLKPIGNISVFDGGFLLPVTGGNGFTYEWFAYGS